MLGRTLHVAIDEGIVRPLIVTAIYGGVVNGVLLCEPEDHTCVALRGWSSGDARITGRPDRHLPIAYAEGLTEGTKIGQWRRIP